MADPATVPPAEASRPRHVPNPLGNPNLHLSRRCGARTRAGAACQAPALHGRPRCRMHGGGSTGPRTEAGMARMRAARTTHGRCSAAQRAWDRHMLMTLRRARLLGEVAHWFAHLPPALVARLVDAPELLAPRFPRGGITPQQDKAMRQQEKAAQAPWWQAVEAARATARAARMRDGKEPHAPVEGVAVGAAGVRAGSEAWLEARHEGGGRGARNMEEARAEEPRAPVTAARRAEDPQQNGIGPHAPVGGARAFVAQAAAGAMARLQAAWLAGDPGGRASAALSPKQTEAHAPVGPGGRVAVVRAEQEQAHAPVTGGGTVPATGGLRAGSLAAIAGGRGPGLPRPSAPEDDGEGEEPHAPVGLTRKQRRRAKWLQRQEAKGR